MNQKINLLSNYLSRSRWKQYLVSAIFFSKNQTLYQKDLMRNKNAGTKFSFNKYIKELETLGVIQKEYDKNKVILKISPNWKKVCKKIQQLSY